MKQLDKLEIRSPYGTHTIELFQGDLTNMPAKHAVDVLVVSAYPNNYRPTRRSLIRSLSDKGISVYKLSNNKAEDLRDSFSCWLSQPIDNKAEGVNFDRILVFEPLLKGSPSEVIGDIFQSLIPFIHGEPHITSIAMPLVGTGRQRFSGIDVLQALMEAVIKWVSLGLPVHTIKIVEYEQLKAAELKGAFAVLKQQYTDIQQEDPPSIFKYDYFISYAHKNSHEADTIYRALLEHQPDARIFIDRQILSAGASWQSELYETIDESEKVIVVYSPDYLESKVCKEEYNIALMRHREEGDVLIPFYLYSANLPTYMKLIQFIDCRENDPKKIAEACYALANSTSDA